MKVGDLYELKQDGRYSDGAVYKAGTVFEVVAHQPDADCYLAPKKLVDNGKGWVEHSWYGSVYDVVAFFKKLKKEK